MNWMRLARFLFAALLITGFTAHSARAGGLIVYVAGLGGEFGTLDLSNPANITYQSIGTTSTEFYGMGFTASGTLYGIGVGNIAGDLYQMNTTNSNITDLGALGFPAIGATVGPDGTMYAVEFSSGNVFALSPPSTNTMFVGNLLLNNGSDGLMAFSPNGTLYTDEASNNGNDILASVNTSTGAATLIGTGMGDYIFSGVFLNGTLFGFAPDGDIYTIDTNSGVATFYGSYSFGGGSGDYISASAVAAAAVPEPSSLALVSIGTGLVTAGSIFLRIRRKN